MIIVKLNIELVYPYSKSLTTLLEFCRLFRCSVLYGGTKKKNAIISMKSNTFKTIFKTNPQKEDKYKAPSGAEHFIKSIKVKDIKIKEKK
jgi:hypothetical protein